MKKRRLSLLIVAVIIILALGIPGLYLFTRPPALVVTDSSFISLYGANRIRLEMVRSSIILFRPVKPVTVADDAGDDIVLFAVSEASARPFCVLFPFRFADAARFYRERFPEIPVVLLEGRRMDRNSASFAAAESTIGDFFLFTTDIEADFYRAGLYAAILDGEKNGRIVVFLNNSIQNVGSEAFLQGVRSQGKAIEPSFFTSYSDFSDFSGISCVVLAGSGVEFLGNNQKIPVIFFTWLNPAMTPDDTVLIFDDSPWAQTVPAVRMVEARMTAGRIPSKTLILSARVADKYILRKLNETADSGWGSLIERPMGFIRKYLTKEE